MLSFFIVLISIFLFSSCTNTAEEAIEEQKSRVTVDFNTFQVDVEDMSRGSDDPLTLADVAKRLSFAIFKADGTLVEETTMHQEKTASGAGFGSVEVELYPGNYKVVAVAHSGSGNATITSTSSATLPGKTITDTFTKVQDLLVVSNQDFDLSMTLDRITSAFILRLNDAPPANVKEFVVVVNTGGEVPVSLDINPSTGRASGNWKQTCTIPVANIGNDVPIYFIAAFSPATVTVMATAYDTNGAEIISHNLGQVPLVRNKRTVATGTFFQTAGTGTFTVETWGEDNNIEY